MTTDVEKIIGALALQATSAVEIFNAKRKDCKYHAFNILTEEHNCFHGNTKTKCKYDLCPLRKDRDNE